MPLTMPNTDKPARKSPVKNTQVMVAESAVINAVSIPKRKAARPRKACLSCGKPIAAGEDIAQITSPLTGKKTWVHANCVEQNEEQPSGVDAATLKRLDGLSAKVADLDDYMAVSYTHLTLPTTPYV